VEPESENDADRLNFYCGAFPDFTSVEAAASSDDKKDLFK